MNMLTSNIAVPQITNLRVVRVAADLDESAIYCTVNARSSGGLIYGSFMVIARNGMSQGIRATVAPTGFTDRIEVTAVLTPSAFTDVLAAHVGGNLAIRNSAVESALIAAGLIPAGTVT